MSIITLKKAASISCFALASLFFINCSDTAIGNDTASNEGINENTSAEEVTAVQTSLSDDAKESLSEAKEAVSESLEEAGDKIVETADNIGDKVQESSNKLAKGSNKVKDKIVESATKIKDKVVAKKESPKGPNGTSNTKPSAPPINSASSNKTSEINEEKPRAGKPAPVGVNHEAFDQLLRKHVSSKGAVDYAGLKSDLDKFDAYLEELRLNPVKSNWPREKQLAYWINAYNAFTIKMILNNYPLAKITDLENGKPWDKTWIKLGDKTYSLNNIENDIIRPQFKEPRIHFAVNCAAKSCPPLLNRAWTGVNLEKYFSTQTKDFINNEQYNNISSSEARVSKIFDWYGEDFGDLKAFLNKYSDTMIKNKTEIDFKEYDWSLNDK